MIAHLSDLHLGSHDDQARDSIAADVAAQGADLTVVSGDLTIRATEEQFDAAVAFLTRLPSPQLVVLGNHDIPLYDAVERFTSPYDRYRERVTESLDPVLDVPGARIQGLASMPRWRWKAGRVSERQIGVVESSLGTAPQGALRVLALHHPPFVGGAERIKGGGGLRRAIGRARVDLLLAGHTHLPSTRRVMVETDDGDWPVVECVAGTAVSDRTRGSPRAWAQVVVTSDDVTVVHREHRGRHWEEATRDTFPRVTSTLPAETSDAHRHPTDR